MALESATYIDGLVTTNPDAFDTKGQGDDHLRLLKRTLKNTFPSLDSAVTATPAQLNAVSSPGVLAFPGMIVMWSGSIANIPSGWQLCNGTGSTAAGPIPNLMNRMVICAGDTYAVNASGGSKDAIVVSHTHTGTINNATLTGSASLQTFTGFDSASGILSTSAPGQIFNGLNNAATLNNTLNINATHTHTATINTTGVSGVNANLPPYFALAFIIKL